MRIHEAADSAVSLRNPGKKMPNFGIRDGCGLCELPPVALHQSVGVGVVGDLECGGVPLELLAVMAVGDVTKEGGFGERTGEGEVTGGCSAAEAGVDVTVVVVSGLELRAF